MGEPAPALPASLPHSATRRPPRSPPVRRETPPPKAAFANFTASHTPHPGLHWVGRRAEGALEAALDRVRPLAGGLREATGETAPVEATRPKSKNHTNHNQNKKAHRNGIKKPATNKYPSMKGVDPKFRRNARYAAQGTQKALAAARASA
ncbi:hypothetical protein Rhopal_004685-T1 [Rhodotorula paludigena]|uniref:60S ribosomal protein L29 n=1 Tax=Rhodotorula paludigena TaxID=86838 RepID=A0AAV5GQL3_9BASI|nr:hypothetical protein Rhopal_004685-T1 [Rhodotorula paludigena]